MGDVFGVNKLLVDVDVVLAILCISFWPEGADVDGLIRAAIEKRDVAWEDFLRLKKVVPTAVEFSDVGLTDLRLKRNIETQGSSDDYIFNNCIVLNDITLCHKLIFCALFYLQM